MQTKKAVGIGALALGAVVAMGGAALVGPSALAGAQQTVAPRQNGPYAARVHQIFSRVEQELNLTRAQKSQIKAIMQKAVPQGRAVYNDQSLTPVQKQAKLRALRLATQAKLQQVLTPNQRQKVAAMRAGAREQGRAMLQKLAQDLQLSEAQQAQLKPVLEETVADLKSLHNDMSLTIGQKIDRLHQIRNSTQAQVKAVLTPAQERKLEAIKSQVMGAVRAEILQRLQAYRNL